MKCSVNAVLKTILVSIFLVAPTLLAAQPIAIASGNRATPIDFDADILPILRANCISCHNKTTTKGDLNLETPEQIRRGGENGPGFKLGKGLDSLLVRAAAHLEDPFMPPKENKVKAADLTPEQLGLLRQWIDEGAKASALKERAVVWEPVPDSFSGIYAAAVTSNGNYAACARGGQISVYYVPSRQLVARLTDDALATAPGKGPAIAHRDVVPSLVFSPDGKRLASGSFREIKTWLREDTVNTQRIPADDARKAELAAKPPATTFEFDVPTTKQHVSIAKSGTIVVWDAERKTKVREFQHGSEINAATASPNVERIATSGINNVVKIWDVANGVLIAEVKGELAASNAAAETARKAAFLASETVYRQGELTAREAELKKLDERAKKIAEDIKTAQAAVEPKVKARDEAAKAKADVEKAAPPINYNVPDDATLKKRKDAETKLAAAVKKLTDAEADVTRAKDAVTAQQVDQKLVNEQIVTQTKSIADAKAALASADQLQKAADVVAKKALDAANVQQRLVRALAFSPDGLQLATAAADGLVHLWSAVDGTALRTLPGAGPSPDSQRALTWDASGITVTADDGSRVIHAMSSRWKLERTLGGATSPMKDRVNALHFSNDGKTLAAGSGEYSRGGEVTIWNVETGALTKSLPDLHKDSVLTLSYSADGKMLATGSSDRVAKVLDTATWAIVKSFEGHANHVLGISWRAEGRTLATSGADGVVKVWDFASGEKKKNIEGWDGEVTAIQYVGLTANFLTVSADKRVRLLNEAGGEVRVFVGCVDFMQSGASSDDGSTIIAGGQDGVLRIWDGTGKVIAAFPPAP